MAIRAKKLQPAKVEAIANVKSVLEGYNDYIFADYRGLTVEQITELRKQLRAKDCQFKVMKNNFVKVAFDEMKIENLADYLAGPTAIALLKDDPNEVAKILFDFAKETPALQVKGAYIENEAYLMIDIIVSDGSEEYPYLTASAKDATIFLNFLIINTLLYLFFSYYTNIITLNLYLV